MIEPGHDFEVVGDEEVEYYEFDTKLGGADAGGGAGY